MIYSQEIIKETERALKMLEEENRLHPGENIVEVLIVKYQEAIKNALQNDKFAFSHIQGGMKAFVDATYQYQAPLINQLYLVEKLCIESAHKQLTCNKEETIK